MMLNNVMYAIFFTMVIVAATSAVALITAIGILLVMLVISSF